MKNKNINLANNQELLNWLNTIFQHKLGDVSHLDQSQKDMILRWLQNNARKHIVNQPDYFKPVTREQQIEPMTPEQEAKLDAHARQALAEQRARLSELFQNGAELHVFDCYCSKTEELMRELGHFMDFFTARPETLDNLAHKGYPGVKNAAAKWVKWLNQRNIATITDGDERLVTTFDDGGYAIQAMQENVLQRMGEAMNHCVASYWTKVQEGTRRIYSICNAAGKDKIAIETIPDDRLGWASETIVQCRGSNNQKPKPEYLPNLYHFIYANRLWLSSGVADSFGVVQDINYKIYDFVNMPHNLHLTGELNLDASYNMARFPRNLTVNVLDLSGLEFTAFPADLKVNEILRIRDSHIVAFPDDMSGLIDLSLLVVHSLQNSENLLCKLDQLAYLQDITFSDDKLRAFPANMKFPPRLEEIRMSLKKLKALPDGICDIKTLKELRLYKSAIKKLPKRIGELKNLETLEVTHANLVSLPDSITELSNLKYLSFEYNKLEYLPYNIGDLDKLERLDLLRNRLKTVPESISKLKKLTELHLSDRTIESLPNSLFGMENLECLIITPFLLQKYRQEIARMSYQTEIHVSSEKPIFPRRSYTYEVFAKSKTARSKLTVSDKLDIIDRFFEDRKPKNKIRKRLSKVWGGRAPSI